MYKILKFPVLHTLTPDPNYREKKIARVDPETNPTAPKGRRLSWHLTQKERPWSRYNAQKWENMGLGPPAAASEASLHRV